MRRASLAAVLVAALLATTGCPRPPLVLRGEFPPTSVADAQARDATGERVRWGGEIVSVTTRADETCFQVLSLPLDRRAQPRPVDDSPGRFTTCASGFFDPAIYAEKREITVVGTVDGYEDGQVGERPYRFPRVRAESVFLWPKRLARTFVYDPYPYPYYYPYYPYPYPFWGPYWGWGPYGGWGAGWWAGGTWGGHHHHH